MKKLVRASEDMTNLLEDYSELRGYLKAFIEEAKDVLKDMSDEDEEIDEDQLIDFAYQHMRSYFDDLDFERLIKMYISKNIKDINKYLNS